MKNKQCTNYMEQNFAILQQIHQYVHKINIIKTKCIRVQRDRWSNEEDAILFDGVRIYGNRDYDALAALIISKNHNKFTKDYDIFEISFKVSNQNQLNNENNLQLFNTFCTYVELLNVKISFFLLFSEIQISQKLKRTDSLDLITHNHQNQKHCNDDSRYTPTTSYTSTEIAWTKLKFSPVGSARICH
ncbi:SANT/Myb_domain [Hexamita inflata]|uniref:SANT/Myb domain n=1 Tax=Hexamita inflata TaxID=28002 RepID=A0AA86NFY7_9EUKA|nr:SANT/Myb domain [Hexamita inflata]